MPVFKPNIDALTRLPGDRNLKAVVAMSPENFVYASGANIETVTTLRPRQAFAVFPASAAPFVLVCTMEESQTIDESWISDIRGYTEFVHDPVGRLAEELKREGLDSGPIGLDLDYIPAADYARLTVALPQVEFVNTSEAIAEIRAIKNADEIGHLENVTRQTHRAVLDAMHESTLGDDELQMVNRIAKKIIDFGANGINFLYFASGDRTIHPHAHAVAGRVPKPGDIIRLDVGGRYGPFMSDFARTYSAGDPSALQKQVYAELVACETRTIESMRPGITAEDVFYTCAEEFKRRGLVFHMPHVGHSFGIEAHENPMLRPGNKMKLKPGMVINVEPGVRDSEGSLYHTEDLILITETGYRLLTLGIAPLELPTIGQKVL